MIQQLTFYLSQLNLVRVNIWINIWKYIVLNFMVISCNKDFLVSLVMIRIGGKMLSINEITYWFQWISDGEVLVQLQVMTEIIMDGR